MKYNTSTYTALSIGEPFQNLLVDKGDYLVKLEETHNESVSTQLD